MNPIQRSAAALLAACASAAADAQSLDAAQRNWLDVLGHVPRIHSTTRTDVTFSSQPGTTLDLENELGQPRTHAGFGVS